MTDFCSQEIEVVRAIKENTWTDELRNHAGKCPVCSVTVGILPMMRQLHDETLLENRSLPSYQLIWIRAQFTKRQEKLSILDRVTIIGALITGFTGLLGVLIWKVPGVLQSVPGFNEQQLPALIDLAPLGIPVFIIVAALLLYTIFSEVFAVER